MIERGRRLIPAVWLVTCALGGAITACKQTNQPPVAKETLADSAEQVGYGVRTLLTSKGVQRGELLADTMYIYNDQTKFDFRNAKLNFNKETGAPNGTMRADRGIYDLRSQILEGFGNVVITTTDGRTLKSPQLKCNQYANEVSSDTTFEMVAADRTQSGIGFKADPNLTRFSCLRRCVTTGSVNIPSQ